MKLAILAASSVIGVASLIPAASAQTAQETVGRMPEARVQSDTASRLTTASPSALESVRPAAGMLPHQETGPRRDFTATPSNTPAAGGDLQGRLRP